MVLFLLCVLLVLAVWRTDRFVAVCVFLVFEFVSYVVSYGCVLLCGVGLVVRVCSFLMSVLSLWLLLLCWRVVVVIVLLCVVVVCALLLCVCRRVCC